MAPASYPNITVEHLGQDATGEDLDAFNAAVVAVMASHVFTGDPEGATDYVWNGGNIRFDAGVCIYCGRIQADNTIVPDAEDDEDWEDLAHNHAVNCEWITSRAHASLGGS